MLSITSLSNPRIKSTLFLRDRRDRDESGLFLIEGYRELLRAAGGWVIETLFICPELFLGSNEEALIHSLNAKEVIVCSKPVFAKLSYRDRPDGLLGVAQMQRRKLQLKGDFFLVAEGVEKPGNLGSILRSADAAGVDGLIVCDQCTDLYNPNTVRASVGTLFTVPCYEATTEEAIAALKNVTIVAATPEGDVPFTQADFTGPVAIAVGSEQLGLSSRWMEAATVKVRIPMWGKADSLNVAAAATLLLFEVSRQRRG